VAALADARNHFGGGGHVELVARVVIQEEERLGAVSQDVVNTHRDQVDANG